MIESNPVCSGAEKQVEPAFVRRIEAMSIVVRAVTKSIRSGDAPRIRRQLDSDLFPPLMPNARINRIFLAMRAIFRVENLNDCLLRERRLANRPVTPMFGDLALQFFGALAVIFRQRAVPLVRWRQRVVPGTRVIPARAVSATHRGQVRREMSRSGHVPAARPRFSRRQNRACAHPRRAEE